MPGGNYPKRKTELQRNSTTEYLVNGINAVNKDGVITEPGRMREATHGYFQVANPLNPSEKLPYEEVLRMRNNPEIRNQWRERYPRHFKTNEDVDRWLNNQYQRGMKDMLIKANEDRFSNLLQDQNVTNNAVQNTAYDPNVDKLDGINRKNEARREGYHNEMKKDPKKKAVFDNDSVITMRNPFASR